MKFLLEPKELQHVLNFTFKAFSFCNVSYPVTFVLIKHSIFRQEVTALCRRDNVKQTVQDILSQSGAVYGIS